MKGLKNKYSRALLAAPVIALLAMPVAAQAINESSPRVSFTVGATPALNQDRQQRNASIMVGLEYSHPFGRGAFYVTGEWRSFSATPFEATQFSPFDWDTATYADADRTGYAPTSAINPEGKRGFITAFTRRPTADNTGATNRIAPDMRFDSVDMRRALLDGVTAKLAYRYRTDSLPLIGSLGLQGGLVLSYLTAWEYSNGAIHVLDYRVYNGQNNLDPNAAPNPTDPRLDAYGRLGNEYFVTQEKETGIKPGAFIGVRKAVKDNLFFEMNLTMLGYTDITYVPYSYSGQDPHFVKSSKTKTVLEFIAGMRF